MTLYESIKQALDSGDADNSGEKNENSFCCCHIPFRRCINRTFINLLPTFLILKIKIERVKIFFFSFLVEG